MTPKEKMICKHWVGQDSVLSDTESQATFEPLASQAKVYHQCAVHIVSLRLTLQVYIYTLLMCRVCRGQRSALGILPRFVFMSFGNLTHLFMFF